MGVLRAKQRGMSLVEVLVALAILAVVTLSVIGLFSQSISLNASGMDYTVVNNLARDKLEELLDLPFNATDISIDPSSWDYTMSKVKTIPNDLPVDMPFSRTVEIRELLFEKLEGAANDWQHQLTTAADPGTGNIKEITVIVRSTRTMMPGVREIRVVGYKADGLG
jgi:prepilin-type N-terminal cleavage/methylation domain-containing protein